MRVLSSTASIVDPGVGGPIQEDSPPLSMTTFRKTAEAGLEFLRANAGNMKSVTDSGIVFEENFTQLLILDVTKDRSLVDLSPCQYTWNFFRNKPVFSETFPDDLDTTSIAWSVLPCQSSLADMLMRDMSNYTTPEGYFLTYLDETRPRFDHCVNVNVLRFFYTHGAGSALKQSLDFVYRVLQDRSYTSGSRYYVYPECFLYFLSKLLQFDASELDPLREAFTERIRERVGLSGGPLESAMRLISCARVGVSDDEDLRRLISMQNSDGGWEADWLYRFGSTGVRAGSRCLTTALAIEAITLHLPEADGPINA
ncbi:hypothetical protein BDN71DRAFT_415017 [Pleurotus eryngii]|uniref:Uncharacterized protein n=1 Tax=Pleurotus eryngii TaxID=5323 RepID=A0A9P6DI27_PLEER|nr:hypothetical protein BDN71DRAFT_415017 [Pleurotus eryngii]